MRSKTFVLGTVLPVASMLIGIILLSARPAPVEPDTGYNPGEQLPSVEVDGEVWESEDAVVTVWSVSDATSRLVNAWASHKAAAEGKDFLSICIDASQSDAELLARLDNVALDAQVLGAKEQGQLSSRTVRSLASKGLGKVFLTTSGTIQQVRPMAVLWAGIQSNE